MVLDTKSARVLGAQAFAGGIVEARVGDGDSRGKRVRVEGEGVVLGGDGDFSRRGVLDGVVRPVVAELEFKRLAAQGLAQNLMAQADAGDGHPAQEFSHILDDVAERGRVAGAVR